MEQCHIRLDAHHRAQLAHMRSLHPMLQSNAAAVRFAIDFWAEQQQEGGEKEVRDGGAQGAAQKQLAVLAEMVALGFDRVLNNQDDGSAAFLVPKEETAIYKDAVAHVEDEIRRAQNFQAYARRLR